VSRAQPAEDPDCSLCAQDGGRVLWRNALLRVIAVEDPDYPGFLRVVCNAHAREMTDLDAATRAALLTVVLAAEEAVRAALAPDKINLASLGNVVPHVHWHVIARNRADAHFPNPIWGVRLRDPDPALLQRQRAMLPGLEARLVRALDALAPG